MTIQITTTSTPPRHPWRSAGAVLLGFVAVVALSLGTDQVLHWLAVYPPWGQPMHDPGLVLLALAYRIVYTVVGSYIAARFAPRNPMRHALVLGVIGLALSLAGAIATIPMHLAPNWYPIALVLTALPCAWLGGVLHRIRQAER
jgi:small-conductance mechanosensitive channel